MTGFSKLIFLFIPLLVLIISCSNDDDSSAYKELLSKPPYTSLTDSIQQHSSNPDLYYRRGLLLYRDNHYPPALADFKKAWSLNKKEEYAIAVNTVLLGSKPDSALQFLQESLKVLPNSILLQLNLAETYASLQRTDEALAVCNKILEQQDNQLETLVLKATLLESKQDTTGSIKILEKARSFAPYNEEICYNLAFKYAQYKDPKALTLSDSLMRADTIHKTAEPYYFKGLYYANINDKTKALGYFDKAIQNDYTFLDAYMEKGKILYEQKKYKEAIKIFELTLTVSSSYADAYYWVGKCQEALGQKEEAKLNYQRAWGLDKTFTEAKEAAERL